jgi:hypothetical protein
VRILFYWNLEISGYIHGGRDYDYDFSFQHYLGVFL